MLLRTYLTIDMLFAKIAIFLFCQLFAQLVSYCGSYQVREPLSLFIMTKSLLACIKRSLYFEEDTILLHYYSLGRLLDCVYTDILQSQICPTIQIQISVISMRPSSPFFYALTFLPRVSCSAMRFQTY